MGTIHPCCKISRWHSHRAMNPLRRFAAAFTTGVHTTPRYSSAGSACLQYTSLQRRAPNLPRVRTHGARLLAMQTGESDDPQTTFRTFLASRKSLVLATTSDGGEAHASTAPFVRDGADGAFYVMVSGLSAHTGHLARSARVGVLLVADESETTQLFARTRASFDCDVALIPRSDTTWNEVADKFAAQFGGIVGVLRDLQDFCIFRLAPTKGRFVMGFAKAYDVDTKDWGRLVHVGGPSEQAK